MLGLPYVPCKEHIKKLNLYGRPQRQVQLHCFTDQKAQSLKMELT